MIFSVKAEIDYGDGGGAEIAPAVNDISLNPTSWIVSHIYTVPGNYTVTITRLFNELYVDETPLTVEVVVQHALIDLVLTPSNSFTITPPADMSFTMSNGSSQSTPIHNVQCTWGTVPATSSWSTYIAEVPFTMATSDVVPTLTQDDDTTMTITGMCSNMVTTDYAVATDIDIVVDDVTIISFVASDADWWRNATVLTLTLEPTYSNVVYSFEMGESFSTCVWGGLSDPDPGCLFNVTTNDTTGQVQVELSYVYDTWGDFDVYVDAFTESSMSDSDFLTASVLEWDCDPPTLTLPADVSNGNTREIARSETSSITVEWENYCMKTNQVRAPVVVFFAKVVFI